ncbi:Pentatricopeptide repeat-containing protein [Cardamine amara subsp. amara]|uniref:Pentatricopeptide repeat-containing protein n=1 Tax=Cardamine amara subsp. amara TaxID=228776 RepID=A0ABD0Z5X8_CARAN
MLGRVWKSESFAKLISTRSTHRRVAKKGTIIKRLPSLPVHCSGAFGGEELKLTSGFHYIKSLDDAIDLFDDMVRMNRPDVVISLYQKMEMRRIPI